MASLVNYMTRLLDSVAALAMICLLIVTSLNVFSRAVFSKPISGALESSMLLMPVIVFGGMAWVFARVGHFAMTSFIDSRGRKFRTGAFVLKCALTVIVFSLLSIEAVHLFQRSFSRGEFFAGPVNIPVYYSRLMIAVGAIATVSVVIVALLPEGIRKIGENKKPEGRE